MTTEAIGVAAPRPVTPVGILAASLDGIVTRLDRLDGIPADLLAELRTAHGLAAGLDPYLSACSTPESPELSELVRRTRSQDWSGYGDGSTLEQEMLSGHVEGQLLKMLVHLSRARHVLDLGMFTGYSSLAMAEALPADGTVVACELDADVAALAQSCFDDSRAGTKIDVRVGEAAVTLADLAAAGASFDLVFLDADKAGYVGYLTTLLDTGLLAPHGAVCADNTLMQGQPYGGGPVTSNGAAIAHFNQVVVDDPRVEQVVLPLRDGITLIRWAV